MHIFVLDQQDTALKDTNISKRSLVVLYAKLHCFLATDHLIKLAIKR